MMSIEARRTFVDTNLPHRQTTLGQAINISRKKQSRFVLVVTLGNPGNMVHKQYV